MEKLPQLALESVCEYLAYGEPHRASLLAFALVSRTCCAAARRKRFSQISINVDDEQHFHQRLIQLECMLDEAKSRTCVRTLKLGVYTSHQPEREDDKTQDACDMSIRSLPNFHGLTPLQKWKPRAEPRPDQWWQPLAQFISSVHLRDLIWASTEQIPRRVLSVLKEQISNCRLHVYGFDLRSLHQKGNLQDIEDTEYMLATSPGLYNIIVPFSEYDATGGANYNGEAALWLAAGLASNLRHVCMWENKFGSSGEIGTWQRDVRLEWRGFHPQSDSEPCKEPGTKGQLQSLKIDPAFAVSGSQLACWEKHTDFSVLRSLTLDGQIELGVLQNLVSFVERDGLCRLRSLDLSAISCDYEDREEAELTMTRLFLMLNPLVELGVVGVENTTFEAILSRHGDTLQVFRVEDFILSAQQVAHLRESCPKIRKLSIEILRSASNEVEVEAYRTLGSLRNLESLSLVLQVTDYRYNDGPDDPCLLMGPSDDKEDEEAIALAIHQVFVNAAVDESLARSIFRTILAAHTSIKAGLPPRLSSIRLRVGNARVLNGQSMDLDFQGILSWIGRSWICRRDPRDTHQSHITVEEVDISTRLRSVEDLEDDIDEFPDSEQYADIWRALWPKTGAGWREEWRSVPLAGDADSSMGTERVPPG